jgi:hypothetical protein
MSEYSFDDETVRALLHDSVEVISTENLNLADGAPQELRDLVIATVAPSPGLASIIVAQTSAREATWMAGESPDSGTWATLGLTFVDGLAMRLAFDVGIHRERLKQVADGGRLFLVDRKTRETSATSNELLERGIQVFRGGSDALRRALAEF